MTSGAPTASTTIFAPVVVPRTHANATTARASRYCDHLAVGLSVRGRRGFYNAAVAKEGRR